MPVPSPLSPIIRIGIFPFLAMIIQGSAYGVSLPEVNGLDAGQYAVGFTTIEKYDYSRTMRSPIDYFGDPLPGEIARPIQICIWYPAEADSSARKMVFGEYVFPNPEDTRLFDFLSRLQEREILRLHNLLRMDGGLVLDILNAEVGSIRDASPAEGRFPVMLYYGDRGSGVAENMRLFEYLASHGIIVAALHSVGTTGQASEGIAQYLETAARDLEFAVAAIGGFAPADLSRLAVAGYSLGAQAAALTASRHWQVRALIMARPYASMRDFGYGLIENITFKSEGLTVPLLRISQWIESDYREALFSPTQYSDQTLLHLDQGTDEWLTYYALLETMGNDSTVALNDRIAVYESFCKAVRIFIESNLVNDQPVAAILETELAAYTDGPGLRFAEHLEAKPQRPNQEQFAHILQTRGVATAAEVCRQFDIPRPDYPLLPEGNFNQMGYRYLQQGDVTSALEIFGWCTRAYPGSANSWDSYADACMASGDTAAALASWKKSLEVLPYDSTTDQGIRDYIRENTPRRISEVTGDGN